VLLQLMCSKLALACVEVYTVYEQTLTQDFVLSRFPPFNPPFDHAKYTYNMAARFYAQFNRAISPHRTKQCFCGSLILLS